MKTDRGALWLLGAAVLWGTTGTAQTFAPAGTPTSTIGLARLVVGGAALLLVAAASGELAAIRRLPRGATAAAALAMASYQPLFFGAVDRTGVAIGTIVAIGTAPVLAGALGFAIRGERVGARWAIATALGIGGAALLVAGGAGIGVDPGGVALALGAGAAFAVYALAAKVILDDHPPLAAMAAVFSAAAVLLLPFLVVADIGWAFSLRGAAVSLHLGLVATGAAYLLFARGLATTTVAVTATMALAEPLTAAILAVVVVGEDITGQAATGALILLAGLTLLSTRTASSGSVSPARGSAETGGTRS